MENVNRIIEAFKDEKEIIIICSNELYLKLNKEIDDFNIKNKAVQAFFKKENKIDLGFKSIYTNGITLHYAIDFEIIIKDSL